MARPHRDIGPLLQYVRSWLFGRPWKTPHRYQEELAPRPYPPNFPEPGPAEKLSNNAYYLRDARRLVTRPIVLVDAGQEAQKQITSSADNQAEKGVVTKKGRLPPIPAKVYAP